MKQSWDDAPEWASWRAKNGDGQAFYYQYKPRWNWMAERWQKGKGWSGTTNAQIDGIAKYSLESRPNV